ncbi:MAG: SDR family NAD(P)-dependent oxidoreductase [Arenibacterium sp.]
MSEKAIAGLEGKVVMVTGGASGIGKAAAEHLLANGAHVLLADYDAAVLDETVRALGENGAPVMSVVLDVTDEDAQKSAVQQCVETWGRLDGGFNSAGVSGTFNLPMLEMPVAEFQRVIDINLTGLWLSMRAQVAQFMAQGAGGSIVNAASVAGLIGSKVNNAYSASKFAVVGMSRSVAREYGESGVRINAICPGWIETPMTEGLSQMPEMHAAMAARHALGRTGEAHEVGALVAWLISDQSSFMTGAAIPVDGGMTA